MNILQVIGNILFKQYELRVEDYIFYDNINQVAILFKPRFSRCKLKVMLTDVVNNENYITRIHPYDCYIIGVLNRILAENVIPKNEHILRIKHNNEKIKTYVHFMGFNYKKNLLTFEVNGSNTRYIKPITEFIKNTFIIRGLSSADSFQLGFLITDLLINNGEINLYE